VSTTCAGSVCDVIAGYCEECNEFPNLFKGGEFLDYLWDYYLAKNDYVSWSYITGTTLCGGRVNDTPVVYSEYAGF